MSRSAFVSHCALAALLLTCFLLPAPAAAAPGLQAVWAVDDGEKVFQDDLDHPLKFGGAGNSVWNGATVSLFGARNEVVAFQVILQANSEGAQAVNVTVSDLVGSNGGVIAGSHPLPDPNDYIGVGVELFTEHYLNVAQYSYYDPGCGGFYTTAAANPQITGLIPDALIPFSAAAGMGGAPLNIAANRNQGVWVDIYVPRLAPLGLYSGTLTVTANSATVAVLPIQLQVLDFTLPDETHYRSMLFYSRENIAARHDTGCCTTAMWEMILAYNRMAHRHRLELFGTGDWEEIDHIGGTLTGQAFTAANGYQGPGEGVGNTFFSIHTYGWSFGETEAEYRSNSDQWVSWFDANAPDVEYFLYLIDEPQSDMYNWIKQRADWIHNNPGPGHRLPVFITRWPITDLVGYVDIWSMQSPWYDPAVIEAARARGEKCWLYAGNRPETPMDVIDEYGVALRLKPWIAYKSDIRRWFTWETTHWSANNNEPDKSPKNVFVNPVTFDCGGPGGYGDGDGTMFYPGEDAVYPAQDRGYPGPMSSIRMKMYRRGVQDYEYMWMAKQKGHQAQVQTVLDSALPHVMWEAATIPDWSTSNADYEDARLELAELAGDPGIGSAGLFSHSNATFYLRNANSAGVADVSFRYGPIPSS
ncbi:MAG: glycoside hydrolase domain-containing protein, partial [Armatimonadota bacterium]